LIGVNRRETILCPCGKVRAEVRGQQLREEEEASTSSPTFEIRADHHSGNSEREFMVPPPALIDEPEMEGVPSMIGNTVS